MKCKNTAGAKILRYLMCKNTAGAKILRNDVQKLSMILRHSLKFPKSLQLIYSCRRFRFVCRKFIVRNVNFSHNQDSSACYSIGKIILFQSFFIFIVIFTTALIYELGRIKL